MYVDLFSLEAEGATVGPDDAIFYQHLLFHLPGLFFRHKLLSLFTFLLLLPGQKFFSQSLYLLFQL